MMKCIRIAIVFLACAVVAGCAKKPAEVAQPQRMMPEAHRALTMLVRHAERIRTVRGNGTLFAWTRGEKVTEFASAIALPDRIRIETMDALADVTMAAGSRSGRGWVWLPMEDRVFHGRASRRNLRRLVDIDWTVQDLVQMLAGIFEVTDEDFLLRVGAERGLFAVRNRPLTVKVDMKRGVPVRFTRHDDKPSAGHSYPLYEVRYEEYRDVGGIPFPHRIVVHVPGYGYRVVFAYERVELNREIDDSIFDSP